MGINRLNHAVLYVRDADRSARFYEDVLGFSRVSMGGQVIPGALFLQAPGSTNDHDLGLFSVGDEARAVAGRSRHGRAVPPGLGGRHARRPGPAGRPPGGARRAGRRQRPRHHQEPLRQGPRRPRVRGRLDRARRPAATRTRWRGGRRIRPLDLEAERPATAPTPRAASASPAPPPPDRRLNRRAARTAGDRPWSTARPAGTTCATASRPHHARDGPLDRQAAATARHLADTPGDTRPTPRPTGSTPGRTSGDTTAHRHRARRHP